MTQEPPVASDAGPADKAVHISSAAGVALGLKPFFNCPSFSDLTILLPNSLRISVHKVVISASSGCLARLLQQGVLTTNELPVSGVDSDALVAVLAFCYSGECSVSLATVVPVLHVAIRLEVPMLVDACRSYLMDMLDVHTACTWLGQALQLGVEEITGELLGFIKNRFADAVTAKEFLGCTFMALQRILAHNQGQQPDLMLLKAAWDWLVAEPSRAQHLQELMKVVQMPESMNPADLLNMTMSSLAAPSSQVLPGVAMQQSQQPQPNVPLSTPAQQEQQQQQQHLLLLKHEDRPAAQHVHGDGSSAPPADGSQQALQQPEQLQAGAADTAAGSAQAPAAAAAAVADEAAPAEPVPVVAAAPAPPAAEVAAGSAAAVAPAPEYAHMQMQSAPVYATAMDPTMQDPSLMAMTQAIGSIQPGTLTMAAPGMAAGNTVLTSSAQGIPQLISLPAGCLAASQQPMLLQSATLQQQLQGMPLMYTLPAMTLQGPNGPMAAGQAGLLQQALQIPLAPAMMSMPGGGVGMMQAPGAAWGMAGAAPGGIIAHPGMMQGVADTSGMPMSGAPQQHAAPMAAGMSMVAAAPPPGPTEPPISAAAAVVKGDPCAAGTDGGAHGSPAAGVGNKRRRQASSTHEEGGAGHAAADASEYSHEHSSDEETRSDPRNGAAGGEHGKSTAKSALRCNVAQGISYLGRGKPAEPGPNGVPACQVEGCTNTLLGLRGYHQRYKICEYHLTLPSMLRNGVDQRFCQQCGRFQPLTDFDGRKRSCRSRLQRHNDRRRKRNEADTGHARDGDGHGPGRDDLASAGDGELQHAAPPVSAPFDALLQAQQVAALARDMSSLPASAVMAVQQQGGGGGGAGEGAAAAAPGSAIVPPGSHPLILLAALAQDAMGGA